MYVSQSCSNGSPIKGMSYSASGPRFCSQNPHNSSHPSVTPVPGGFDDIFSIGNIDIWYTDRLSYRQSTHTHNAKINKPQKNLIMSLFSLWRRWLSTNPGSPQQKMNSAEHSSLTFHLQNNKK